MGAADDDDRHVLAEAVAHLRDNAGRPNATEADSLDALDRYAAHLVSRGRTAHAVHAAAVLAQRHPESRRAQAVRARVSLVAHDYDQAAASSAAALKLKPDRHSPGNAELEELKEEAEAGQGRRRFMNRCSEHRRLFDSVRPEACGSCGLRYELPPPMWLCPQCFGDGVSSPVWQADAAGACSRCAKAVGRGQRHHCRCCGRLVCAGCSSKRLPVKLLGYEGDERACDQCVGAMADRRAAVAMRSEPRAE